MDPYQFYNRHDAANVARFNHFKPPPPEALYYAAARSIEERLYHPLPPDPAFLIPNINRNYLDVVRRAPRQINTFPGPSERLYGVLPRDLPEPVLRRRNSPVHRRDSPIRRRSSPVHHRGSHSPVHHRGSPSPIHRRGSPSPGHHRLSPSPVHHYGSHSPVRRRNSPPRRHKSPNRRRKSPFRRRSKLSPQKYEDSPIRDISSMWRRDDSPIRRSSSPNRRSSNVSVCRFDSPVRRSNSPVRRFSSPIYNKDSPVHQRGSPVYRQTSPIHQRVSPVYRQMSPAYRHDSPTIHRRNSVIHDSPILHGTSVTSRESSLHNQRDSSCDVSPFRGGHNPPRGSSPSLRWEKPHHRSRSRPKKKHSFKKDRRKSGFAKDLCDSLVCNESLKKNNRDSSSKCHEDATFHRKDGSQFSDGYEDISHDSDSGNDNDNESVIRSQNTELPSQNLQSKPEFTCSELQPECNNTQTSNDDVQSKALSWISYKLLQDPILHKGAPKMYRFDGVVPDDPNFQQIRLRDPRPQTKHYTPVEPLLLPVPRFKIDENYVGNPPPIEVTIFNLNDNIDRNFLTDMVTKFGTVEELFIFYHPTTNKHLGLARMIFQCIIFARECVNKLNKTSVMGKVLDVFLDPFGDKCRQAFNEIVYGSKDIGETSRPFYINAEKPLKLLATDSKKYKDMEEHSSEKGCNNQHEKNRGYSTPSSSSSSVMCENRRNETGHSDQSISSGYGSNSTSSYSSTPTPVNGSEHYNIIANKNFNHYNGGNGIPPSEKFSPTPAFNETCYKKPPKQANSLEHKNQLLSSSDLNRASNLDTRIAMLLEGFGMEVAKPNFHSIISGSQDDGSPSPPSHGAPPLPPLPPPPPPPPDDELPRPLSRTPSPFLSRDIYLKCIKDDIERSEKAKEQERIETAQFLKDSMRNIILNDDSSDDELDMLTRMRANSLDSDIATPLVNGNSAGEEDDKSDDRMSLSSLSPVNEQIIENAVVEATMINSQTAASHNHIYHSSDIHYSMPPPPHHPQMHHPPPPPPPPPHPSHHHPHHPAPPPVYPQMPGHSHPLVPQFMPIHPVPHHMNVPPPPPHPTYAPGLRPPLPQPPSYYSPNHLHAGSSQSGFHHNYWNQMHPQHPYGGGMPYSTLPRLNKMCPLVPQNMFPPQNSNFYQPSGYYNYNTNSYTEDANYESTDPHTRMVESVLEFVAMEMKQVLKRDVNKKLIETTAFPALDLWWDEQERRAKNDSSDVKNDQWQESSTSAANLNQILDSGRDGLETLAMTGLSLGFRACIPKMPSFKRRKPETPPPSRDENQESDIESEDDQKLSRRIRSTSEEREDVGSFSDTSSSTTSLSSSSSIVSSDAESEDEQSDVQDKTATGRLTPKYRRALRNLEAIDYNVIRKIRGATPEGRNTPPPNEEKSWFGGKKQNIKLKSSKGIKNNRIIAKDTEVADVESSLETTPLPPQNVLISPTERDNEPSSSTDANKFSLKRKKSPSTERDDVPSSSTEANNLSLKTEISPTGKKKKLFKKLVDPNENLNDSQFDREMSQADRTNQNLEIKDVDVERDDVPSIIDADHSYCLPRSSSQEGTVFEETTTPVVNYHDHSYVSLTSPRAHTPPPLVPRKRGRKRKIKEDGDIDETAAVVLKKNKELKLVKPVAQIIKPKTATFTKRNMEDQLQILIEFLTHGIDEEDIKFIKRQHELLLADDKSAYWHFETNWVDHPPTYCKPIVAEKIMHKTTDNTVHKTGCARTEGYYKIDNKQKQTYMSLDTELRSAFDDKKMKNVKMITISREARSNQRRLLTAFGSTSDSDLLKFNILKFRKKQLKFAKSSIHDWGLFAMEPIAADEMVIEYVGQMVRPIVADVRERHYEATGIGSSYLFRIDTENIIDATKCGNLARFINHSCNPNCYAKIITIDGQKKIVIYSKQQIAENEEITYDYKFPLEDVKIPCLCGATACRGFLN